MLRYRLYEDRTPRGGLSGYRVVIEQDRVKVAEFATEDEVMARKLLGAAQTGEWEDFSEVIPSPAAAVSAKPFKKPKKPKKRKGG